MANNPLFRFFRMLALSGLLIHGVSASATDCRKEPHAQCADTKLAWVDWRGANLEGANFAGADLEWANLEEANLKGAQMAKADLKLADLESANLRGARLDSAHLGLAQPQKSRSERGQPEKH